jgi:pimeloyl-ACP methyl ester carboxylesterase
MSPESKANQTIVFLHPFPFDSRIWHEVQEKLMDHGYLVLTPNFRGCGNVDLGTQPPDIELLGQDIWNLLDLAGISEPIVIGISLGGYVAMSMLRQRPLGIAGLGLVDTKASADSTQARATRMATAASMSAHTDVTELTKAMLPRLLSEFTQNHRVEETQEVLTWMQEASATTIAWLQRAMAHRPSSLAQLAKFAGPVLLMRGSEDQVCTAQDYAEMSAVLPSAEYVEIPNTAHLPPVEDPEATAAAIQSWLQFECSQPISG